MITGAILSFLASLMSAAMGILPTIAVPSWLSGNGSAIATVFSFGSSMGVWVPTGLIMTVLAAYFAVKMIGFGIWVARTIVSHLTGGGGAL